MKKAALLTALLCAGPALAEPPSKAGPALMQLRKGVRQMRAKLTAMHAPPSLQAMPSALTREGFRKLRAEPRPLEAVDEAGLESRIFGARNVFPRDQFFRWRGTTLVGSEAGTFLQASVLRFRETPTLLTDGYLDERTLRVRKGELSLSHSRSLGEREASLIGAPHSTLRTFTRHLYRLAPGAVSPDGHTLDGAWLVYSQRKYEHHRPLGAPNLGPDRIANRFYLLLASGQRITLGSHAFSSYLEQARRSGQVNW